MPFLVKTNKGYIKRTSNFGMFHGSIILTDDSAEAYRFTRKHDAHQRGLTAMGRTKEADGRGMWYSEQGRDYEKFGGPLTFTLEEV